MPDVIVNDTYLSYIAAKMGETESCGTSCSQPGHPTMCGGLDYWVSSRTNPACNYNTSNNSQQAISWDSRDTSAYTIGIPAGVVPNANKYALGGAQDQVSIAETHLCIAQKLREQTVTAPGLLLQESDIQESLEVIRETSQLAMLQYGLLSIAFTATDTRVLSSYTGGQILGILRAFANDPKNATKLTRIGQDFAAAIELHAQVTRELADDLARNASARTPIPNLPSSKAAIDWGAGSWRERTLRLLYGGDPLAASASSVGDTLWQSFTPSFIVEPTPLYVSDDARTPTVDELLTYARRADALYFLVGDPVDFQSTAVQLYRTVEASIRHPSCVTAGSPSTSPTCEQLAWGADIPDPVSAPNESALFQNRKIVLADATRLVTRLGESIPTEVVHQGRFRFSVEGAMHFTGPQRYVAASAASATLPGAPSGDWYHLSADALAAPPTIVERSTPYLSSFYMPMSLDIYNVGTTQGFDIALNGAIDSDSFNGSTRMRSLGAVSALAATRDALFTSFNAANGSTGTAPSRAFVSAAIAALPLVDASIGSRTVAVRPEVTSIYADDACTEWGAHAPTWCWVIGQDTSQGNPVWSVTVQTTPTDAFTQLAVVVAEGGMIGSAVLDPSFVSYTGASLASLLGAPSTILVSPIRTEAGPNGSERRVYSVPIAQRASLVLVQPGTGGAPNDYQLLFTPTTFNAGLTFEPVNSGTATQPVWKSLEGRWVATGGSLNAFSKRLWSSQPENWSQPRYDGFGLPTNWFPPAAPDLFGGQPGETAISFYRAQAQTAALNAQTAVANAVQELIAKESDANALDLARQKAATISALDQRALCGTSSSCQADTTLQSFALFGDLALHGQQFIRTLDCNSQGVDPRLCVGSAIVDQYNQILQEAIPSAVNLPYVVWQHRWDATPPTFAEYAGGTLQKDFQDDWQALHELQLASRDASFAIAARLVAAAAGQAAVDAAGQTVADACSQDAWNNAMAAGHSCSESSTDEYDLGTLLKEGKYPCGSFSFSPGPIIAQQQACSAATVARGPTIVQAAAALADAWSTGAQALSTIVTDVSAMHMKTSVVLQDSTASSLAIAQANLDATLTAAALPTRFGTRRRFYSYDMRAAQQAMLTARKAAATARRAIESRFVVDLSSMSTDEAFVFAPSSWADLIYGSDLAPLDAIGLSVPSALAFGAQKPVNTGFFTQYAGPGGYLDQFVAGYFADTGAGGRDGADHPTQSDVIMLPAPDGRKLDVNGNLILDPGSFAWLFQCKGSTQWIQNPAAAQIPTPTLSPLLSACNGAAPSIARYTFSLDGWGRLNADQANVSAQDQLVHNFNVRWNRLSINLLGSGIKDCTTAIAGSACNPARLFVPFNMNAYGPGWVTDYDESWHVLDVPTGVIENGQAGISGTFWSVPGPAQSEIDTLADSEFVARPVSGTYQLDLSIESGVDISNITAVQLYTDMAYWVRQKL